MSGFEVIGVVLGAYPVVMEAYRAYTATKSHQGIESLIRKLRTEEIVYDGWVSRLLAPNVSEADLFRLKTTTSNDPRGLSSWQDFNVQSNLTARLGFQRAHQILSIVKDIGHVLESIKEDVPGVGREFEHQRPKVRNSWRYFRQNFGQSPFKDKLLQLREYNETLERLLDERNLPSSTGKNALSVSLPHRDYSDAKHIYFAMCNAYRCNCENPHIANLELPSIATPAYQMYHGINEHRLQLSFPVQETLSSKAEVSVYECLEDRNDAISDLCYIVRTFCDSNNIEPDLSEGGLGILQSDDKKYKLEAPQKVKGIHPSESTVSLEELTNSKSTLSRRDRMSLALRLSYAIVQFYSTGWIDSGWSWKDFSVAQTDGQKTDESHLFVSQKFYSASNKRLSSEATPSNQTGGIWDAIGEPILTRLGFALIELAIGQRLAELREVSFDQSMPPDVLDFFTARRLLKSGRVKREESRAYEDVVRACLEHQYLCRSEIKSLDSRNTSFQRDVEQSIIVPLHSIWTEAWG